MMRGLQLVKPDVVKLTRRQALAGAAAGALGAAGVYELVDRFAGGSPQRAAAGSFPPEQHVLDGVQSIIDNRVEVLVPPLHHQLVTAKVTRRPRAISRDAQRSSRTRSRGSRRATSRRPPGSASPSPGGCRTSSATSPRLARDTRRSTAARKKPALLPTRTFPERPGRDGPRGERRRRPPPQRPPRPHRRRRPSDLRRARHVRRHEHPQGLRRRRPAEEDGAGGGRPRRRADPGQRGALPRLHVDADAGPRAAQIANLETLGYVDLGPALLPARARTCTSRTSTRTSRTGT